MSTYRTSRTSRETGSRASRPLPELPPQDRDTIFRAPAASDWALLALVVFGLLGTGIYDWYRLGPESHAGRAVFFGLGLVCVYWIALVYTFKLSVSVWVGPQGISLVRGPWRTELTWAETARLVERTQANNARRYRWVVVFARDGRQLRVREDMVADYLRFRGEVYQRYLLWRDHGGTWGTTGGGPYSAGDLVAPDVTWWLIGGAVLLLPGLYFWLLLPETGLFGPVVVALAALCFALALRLWLGKQSYTVDAKAISRRRPLQPRVSLAWRDVARVERNRHPVGGVIRVGIWLGRLMLDLAARTDSRFESFSWSPRVPEYLVLRGGGRQVRIRLHRLAHPDEMLAWVEFYERVARHTASERAGRVTAPIHRDRPASRPVPVDLSATSGPLDPWGAGREGELVETAEAAASPQASPPDFLSSRSQPLAGRQSSTASRPLGSGLSRDEIAGVVADGDAWLWDTGKMPSIARSARSAPLESAEPAAPPSQQRPEQSVPAVPSGNTSGAWTEGWNGEQGESWLTDSRPSSQAAPQSPPQAAPQSPPQSPPQSWPWSASASRPRPVEPPAPAVPPTAEPGWGWAAPATPFQHSRPWAQQPPAAMPPPQPHQWYQPPDEPEPAQWDPYVGAEVPDEVPEGEDVPTDSVDSLADSFAVWRNENWQRPPLPRFGPSQGEPPAGE